VTNQRRPDLREVVGANLRAARQEAGVSQDGLAHLVYNGFGLPWTRKTVRAVESGRRPLDLAEFVALVVTLSGTFETEPSKHPLDLPDTPTGPPTDRLLQGSGLAGVGESMIDLERLRAILAGRPEVWAHRDGRNEVIPATNLAVVAYGEAFREHYREKLEPVERAARGEAEQKSAARLGETPYMVAALAFELWGRSLTDERDARVAEQAPEGATARTLQALRGHVTRGLDDELAERIEEEG
jgi:hypothetical protein